MLASASAETPARKLATAQRSVEISMHRGCAPARALATVISTLLPLRGSISSGSLRGHRTVFGVIILSVPASLLRYWIGGAIANAIVDPFAAAALTLMNFQLRESPVGHSAAAAPAQEG
jgi:hypothetical protein